MKTLIGCVFTFEIVLAGVIFCLIVSGVSGCGSGSGHPDITISNSNTSTNTNTQNQGSQNGDQNCVFKREPIELADGSVVCKVTLECNGSPVANPQFADLPSDQCVTSDVATNDSEAEMARLTGLEQDGAL